MRRAKGAKLAGMVIGGGTEGRQRMEAQGISAGGLAEAINFAREAYHDVG